MLDFLSSKRFLLNCFLIITYIFILFHFSIVLDIICFILLLLTPFFYGFIIAYLMNPIVYMINRFSRNVLKYSCPIWLSLLWGYFIVLLFVLFLIVAIIPQLLLSINTITSEVPIALSSLLKWIESDLSQLLRGNSLLESGYTYLTNNIDTLVNQFGSWLEPMFIATKNVTLFIVNFFLGFIISVYMLLNKKLYIGQSKKIVYALFPKEKCDKILKCFSIINSTFSNYITARVIDSIIIGVLCYIGCLLLGFNNAVLISFVVGITNIIPYFGPFIGTIPCSLVVLLQGPNKMLLFLIFVLVLQQFDGNILGPKLLGDSLGITSLWVLFGVILTTGLFGIMGMLIGVPIFSLFYMYVRSLIHYSLEKKGLSKDTLSYIYEEDYTKPLLKGKDNKNKKK